MQLLATCDAPSVPEDVGPSQRQILGDGWKVQVATKSIGAIHGTTSNDTVRGSIDGGDGSQSSGGGGAGGGHHPQLEGRGQSEEEQLKQRPVGKQLDAAKTAPAQAATMMTK